ncbi:hypothetical protein LI031_09795 [Enterocloster citroniae]|uniref:rolling circle replication-associated protein n=1 Tax=Enterocloster citroniae TaxID=358743 RepID=UPI001D099CEF|nr:hypothetical protein [Enterocloster citroniae]MCB7064132.1 hypothetical protein [Enterocloster citroniae]
MKLDKLIRKGTSPWLPGGGTIEQELTEMACIESVCYAGRTKHIRAYYSAKYNDGKLTGQKEKRTKRGKPTSEKQAEINRKHSLRILTWIMDANFSGADLYVTYSFAKDKRPGDPKKFRACVKQFLKQLRKIYRNAGVILKYIWVGERGERGAEHIHMVQSGGIDIRCLKIAWPHGWINVVPMDESGSYHKLASYFIEYSDKTMRTEGRLQGKRYNPSQNLVRPEPEKDKVNKSRRIDPGAIKVPKGYYLDKESVQSGIQENDYEFLEYTLVLLPGYYIAAHERAVRRQGRKKRSR